MLKVGRASTILIEFSKQMNSKKHYDNQEKLTELVALINTLMVVKDRLISTKKMMILTIGVVE